MIFIVEIFITMKKDLTIFIKLVSYGTFFIVTLMLFIVGVGFYSLANTHFHVTSSSIPTTYDGNSLDRNIHLFNTDFSPLAGLLGIGYFLHTVSLPIIKNNKN